MTINEYVSKSDFHRGDLVCIKEPDGIYVRDRYKNALAIVTGSYWDENPVEFEMDENCRNLYNLEIINKDGYLIDKLQWVRSTKLEFVGTIPDFENVYEYLRAKTHRYKTRSLYRNPYLLYFNNGGVKVANNSNTVELFKFDIDNILDRMYEKM